MLPDQFPSWSQTGYEWVYEEIFGADFSTLTKVMEGGFFLTLFPHYYPITLYFFQIHLSDAILALFYRYRTKNDLVLFQNDFHFGTFFDA